MGLGSGLGWNAAGAGAGGGGSSAAAWVEVTDAHLTGSVVDPLNIVDSLTYDSATGWTAAFTETTVTRADGVNDPVPMIAATLSSLPALFGADFDWAIHNVETCVIPLTYVASTTALGMGCHIDNGTGDANGCGWYGVSATNLVAYRIGRTSTATLQNATIANILGIYQLQQLGDVDTTSPLVEYVKNSTGWTYKGTGGGNDWASQDPAVLRFGIHACHVSTVAIGASLSCSARFYVRRANRGAFDP